MCPRNKSWDESTKLPLVSLFDVSINPHLYDRCYANFLHANMLCCSASLNVVKVNFTWVLLHTGINIATSGVLSVNGNILITVFA